MLIFGASGHAKVIIENLEANHVNLRGCFDDNISIKNILGYKSFGRYNKDFFPNENLLIAIGDNKTRQKVASKIFHEFAILVSKNAIVSKRAEIGKGTVVFQGAIIQVDVKIGKHCIINTKSTVDHDCQIGNFVHIAPGATLCGGISVGEGTIIGAGATILPNLKIGNWCVIGAGSVVTKDIIDNSIIKGNPGKINE